MSTAFVLLAALAAAVNESPCERSACSCVTAANMGLTAEEFVRMRSDRAERVAMGTVVRIDTLESTTSGMGPDGVPVRPIVARVRVREVWRGSVTDTMTVWFTTVQRRSSCDLELSSGKDYLIFAGRTSIGPLSTHYCSGTEEKSAAASTLEILGPGTPSLPRAQ